MSIQLDPGLNLPDTRKSWQSDILPYRSSKLGCSLWQLATSLVPFLLVWYVMYLSLAYSYWLTLALAPLAAGFQVRLFIIFHDCTHNAFFKSQRANVILGSLCGIVCFTPYYHWRHFHAIHHATTGNLAKRMEEDIAPLTIKKCIETNGDVFTLTVKEYLKLSSGQRMVYRFYRQLPLYFIFLPLFIFLVMHRLANAKVARRERYSVYWTNLGIGILALGLSLTIGIGPLVLIELPILALSATVGVWLFYVQHQFEETYWEGTEWNFVEAALQGSSYYKLPRILQWFTGNIGFHHIHHLNPRIPNYNLQKCHESSLLFQQTKPITLRSGLKSIFFRLWDEDKHKMVGFKQLKRSQPEEAD